MHTAATKPPPLHIRPLTQVAELEETAEIQRQAWNIQDDFEVVPPEMLMALVHSGGIVLGCRDEAGRLLGFVYSFLGWDDHDGQRRLKHHSHQMGVLPEARGFGLGFQLKLAQREAVLNQGVDLITWTYDPLQPVNARLNIGRLRAIARRYSRNFYGEMTGINAGLPSDRFEVEWLLRTPRAQAAATGQPAGPRPERIISAGTTTTGLPVPAGKPLPLDGEPLSFEVPADLQQLKERDLALALEWRMASREWFETAFAAGYAATDAWAADGHAFYALERAAT